MKLFGLMAVRNEADILRANLCHHLSNGIDRILVVDNGSTDGTSELLDEFARTGRVQNSRVDGPFRQAEITTALAHEAWLQGADWVLPIDADEFWCATASSLREVLERATAAALEVEVINFVQRREQLQLSPDALLTMTWRVAEPAGTVDSIAGLVESRTAAFVEIRYPPKWISRASSVLEIQIGNHNVQYVGGEKQRTDQIVCLHAPLRARSILEARVPQARRYAEGGNDKVWHIYRWARLADAGGLDQEWLANSHEAGALDVYGKRHPVMFDPRLRDVVEPWLKTPMLPLPAALERTTFSLPELERSPVGPVIEAMKPVEGWFSEGEASLLMGAAVLALAEHGPLPIVEVGSYCGRSTVCLGGMAIAMGTGARVHAIDPHEGEVADCGLPVAQAPTFERFVANVERAGVAAVIVPVRKCSYEVRWSGYISLLLVDGFHDYGNVSRDFRHFEPWVPLGGYVAFHDYDSAYPDVQRFVSELLASSQYEVLQSVNSLIVLRRVGPSTDGLYNEVGSAMPDQSSQTDRLQRLETGLRLLRDVWKLDTARWRDSMAERDQALLAIQSELHSKVGECNRIISALQQELLQKVGQRDELIRSLQDELLAKVGDRDRSIVELQHELHTKVNDCNSVIVSLQEQVAKLTGQVSKAPAGAE